MRTATTAQGAAADGVMHILLYGGIDCGMIVSDSLEQLNSYANLNTYAVGLADGVNVDWSNVTASGGSVQYDQLIAYWRLVSAGARLSLLNPAEEDDGWFEACRVHQPLDSAAYYLINKDGDSSSGGRATKGTFAPAQVLDEMKTDQIVNQASYTSGTLRDLKNMQFNLNPVNENDLMNISSSIRFDSSDVIAVDTNDQVAAFNTGKDDVQQAIKKHIDTNHDYIYIRIHGRGTGSANPTRLLCNVISNQEVIYDNDSNLSRYHQPGDSKMDMDMHADTKRRQDGGVAAVPVSSSPGH
jgi:hypothetical protein